MLGQAWCFYPGSTHGDTCACQSQYFPASCLSDSKPVLHTLHSAKKLCTPRWIAADWFLSGRVITYEAYVHTDGKRRDSNNRPRHFFSQSEHLCTAANTHARRKEAIILSYTIFTVTSTKCIFCLSLLGKKSKALLWLFFLPLDQSNKKPPEVPREAVWYILN